MARRVVRLQGSIQSLCFRGQPAALATYDLSDFDINKAYPACKLRLDNSAEIALSKWTGPKRTRTYPLAKVYDTYSHCGKVVTVIPILKDEGVGERKNDTNLDRINFVTFSWMNLMGVYIILAWYSDATRKDDYRITNQKFDNDYVREKIREIAYYKMDAHHWNQEHFTHKFVEVYEKALLSYESIEKRLGVKLHSRDKLCEFLNRVRSDTDNRILDLKRFAVASLPKSEQAALREVSVEHRLEQVDAATAKGFFEICNNLGGIYYLTADEIIFESERSLIIQESKNSVKKTFPSLNDIKDGLFKLLLFSQLKELKLDGTSVHYRVQLKLSGAFRGRLELPTTQAAIEAFAASLGSATVKKLNWLNEELKLLGIAGVLEGNL
ncbi:MAG: hypothetical protein ACK4ME_03155 [Fimbriimonadales bacterium]